MLILSRKLNEEIKISPGITIKIVSISENQVKIGIDAPENVKIFRGEMYDKVKENTLEATQHSKEKLPDDIKKFTVNRLKK
jgi:carbon storage regulator